jgi:hypothetical protein
MSQGRKRGYAGIIATQRLSKFRKDAAAEANNVMIGRTWLDATIDRTHYFYVAIFGSAAP